MNNELDAYVNGLVNSSSQLKNFDGERNYEEHGLQINAGNMGLSAIPAGMSVNALRQKFKLHSQTITIDTQTATPTQALTVNIFQAIRNLGVAQPDGNTVRFLDPANNAKYAIVSGSTDDYQAIREESKSKHMHLKMIRMVVDDASQFSAPITPQDKNTFGGGAFDKIIPSDHVEPSQLNSVRADIPLDKVIKGDSGFDIVVNPGRFITLTLFYTAVGHAHAGGRR